MTRPFTDVVQDSHTAGVGLASASGKPARFVPNPQNRHEQVLKPLVASCRHAIGKRPNNFFGESPLLARCSPADHAHPG
jgi:hypothetical protein